jgi:hypothetical protein
MHKVKTRSPKAEARSAVGDKSPEDIARTLKLDKGLGFLVRLLDTRFKTLYEQLTAQSDITPRQFGVLLTLHQRGTLTLTNLARYIQVAVGRRSAAPRSAQAQLRRPEADGAVC